MSWAAVGSFFKDFMKSPWMKNQAPHVVVLFVILFMIGFDVFMVRPAERAETRAAEERMAAQIKEGYQEQETEQTAQVKEIVADNRKTTDSIVADNRKTVDRLLDSVLNQNQHQKQELNLGWDLNRAIVDLKRLAMKQEQPRDAMPTSGMRSDSGRTGSSDAGSGGGGIGTGGAGPGEGSDAGGIDQSADHEGSP